MRLDELVNKYGVSAKLKTAIMKQNNWKYFDWYTNWPTLSKELEEVVKLYSKVFYG